MFVNLCSLTSKTNVFFLSKIRPTKERVEDVKEIKIKFTICKFSLRKWKWSLTKKYQHHMLGRLNETFSIKFFSFIEFVRNKPTWKFLVHNCALILTYVPRIHTKWSSLLFCFWSSHVLHFWLANNYFWRAQSKWINRMWAKMKKLILLKSPKRNESLYEVYNKNSF